MGDQVKQSFGKVKESWGAMAPRVKRILIIGIIGLLAFAVALTLFLNLNANRWTLLYSNLESTESSEIYTVLQEMGLPAQLNGNGEVMVQAGQRDYIIGQMAMKSYPKSTLTYDIFEKAGGLTTTDFEKQRLDVFQLQDRLQDTINLYDGVKSSVVTLNVAQNNTRVWESAAQKSSGSVTVQMNYGETLDKEEVSGIKYLVATSIPNMSIEDVVVIDAATRTRLLSAEDEDAGDSLDFERLYFEERVEQRLCEKAMNVLSLAYPPDEVRVSASVVIDYAKMATESKQYSASPTSTNNSGVLEHQDTAQTTTTQQNAQGIPGEEDNTDVPTYNNQLAAGNQTTDTSSSSDYAVSYILQQIEKDRAELKSATISVALKGPVDDEVRQSVVDNVSKATGIAAENVSVQSYVIDGGPGGAEDTEGFQLTPVMMLAIGGGFLLLLLLIILLLVLLGKKKKKRKEEQAEEEQFLPEEALKPEEVLDAEDAEFNLQQELEERKRQLRENATANTADEAITNEVREFARNNPEITATLLRAWMKEDID